MNNVHYTIEWYKNWNPVYGKIINLPQNTIFHRGYDIRFRFIFITHNYSNAMITKEERS